jgi:hypothetical protein
MPFSNDFTFSNSSFGFESTGAKNATIELVIAATQSSAERHDLGMNGK